MTWAIFVAALLNFSMKLLSPPPPVAGPATGSRRHTDAMHSSHRHFYSHPKLGQIIGRRLGEDVVQFRSVPYASTAHRFARSTRLSSLPSHGKENQNYYSAVEFGPSCIQSLDSFETDIRWNQLPPRTDERAQTQSEDCLRITLTVPTTALEASDKKLPVVIFIHGGALMVASGEREYYDPLNFCKDAIKSHKPVIFASINYRLGAFGFLHSPEASDLLPPNNGLYDQINGFDWLRTFVAGFGGDPNNMTAIGQSAGAASLSLHSSLPRHEPLYRRAIILSGSSVVLVTMTPEEHHAEFLHHAERLGIETGNRSAKHIAQDLIGLSVSAIRSLNVGGAPCSATELIPSKDWATMEHARHEQPNAWLESQLVGSCTFDGSISYIVALGQQRKDLAAIFIAICKARMKSPDTLLDIYDISVRDSDHIALEKICQIVTDLGFFSAAVSHAIGAYLHTDTYLQLFDVANPFEGILDSGRFATHTWDIVALLGPYDHLLCEADRRVISAWRQTVIEYCNSGTFVCKPYTSGSLNTLIINKKGLHCAGQEQMATSRAIRLMKLAEDEAGEGGCDVLWDRVVRFFLKTGNPRYAHEAEALLKQVNES